MTRRLRLQVSGARRPPFRGLREMADLRQLHATESSLTDLAEMRPSLDARIWTAVVALELGLGLFVWLELEKPLTNAMRGLHSLS